MPISWILSSLACEIVDLESQLMSARARAIVGRIRKLLGELEKNLEAEARMK